MSPARRCSRRPPLQPLQPLLALALGACGTAAAQQAAPGPEPVLVVTRTVHPRIAYRALAPVDNPVAAHATLFPSRQFAGVIDAVGAQLVGDDALGQRGSAGLAGAGTGQDLQLDQRLRALSSMGATPAAADGPVARSGPRGIGGLGSVLSGAVLRATQRAGGGR